MSRWVGRWAAFLLAGLLPLFETSRAVPNATSQEYLRVDSDLRAVVPEATRALGAARLTGDLLEIPPSTRIHILRAPSGGFLGLGRIQVSGNCVRGDTTALRVKLVGRELLPYSAWILERADISRDGREVVLRTSLKAPDGSRDQLGWRLRGEEWKINGRKAVGFSYRFEFHSRARQVHQILEHASWRLGEGVEGLLYLEQAEGYGTGSRCVRIEPQTEIKRHQPLPAKETPESRQGVGDYVEVLSAANASLVRFVSEPALTFKDSYRSAGAKEIETEERHVAPLTSHFISSWVTVLLHPEGGVNAWFRIRDAVAERLREEAGIPWQAPLPWVGIPSFDVADWTEDLDGHLDFYQRMGFRRLWKWSLYQTDWSEWESLSEEEHRQLGKLPLSHSVLRLDWASRLPVAKVEELCRKANERRMEVILWFPTAHLSPLSPLLKEHPNWIVRRRDLSPFNYVYAEIVGVSYALGYSRYALDRLQVLRKQAPFRGVFLDSFQVFGSDAINYGAPRWDAQFPALLDFLRALRREQLTVMVEGHTPFAVPASTGFLQNVQSDPEFLLYRTNPHWGGQTISPERYFRLVAFMAPPLLDEKVWWSDTALQRLGGYVNHAYNRLLPEMDRCEIAGDERGVVWWSRDETVASIFAFEDSRWPFGRPIASASDAVTGEQASVSGPALEARAYRVYRVELTGRGK